jgi:hypothetical protein
MKGIYMQEQVTPRQGNAAFIWKWGVIFGLILGAIRIILALLPIGIIGTIIEVLVWLIGFFLIGIFASRRTGRVGTGALMGLVTGLIGGLIAVIFAVIQIAANAPEITNALHQAAINAKNQGQTISQSELRAIAVVGIVIGLIVTVGFELGLGAGIGALGGLVGRSQARPPASMPPADNMWTPPPSYPPSYPPDAPPPVADNQWTPPPTYPPPPSQYYGPGERQE